MKNEKLTWIKPSIQEIRDFQIEIVISQIVNTQQIGYVALLWVGIAVGSLLVSIL